jgi:hypothetical protein
MSMSGVLSTRGGGSPAGYPAAATSTRGSFGALGPQSQRVPTIVPANQVTLKKHVSSTIATIRVLPLRLPTKAFVYCKRNYHLPYNEAVHALWFQQPLGQQYGFDLGDDSYYDELIDPDPRRHVEFPFNIHILELSTLDLLGAHQLKRNQPVVKAFCDTFYSETKPTAEYSDVTYFRELNWIFPVKDKSIFKITVASRGKDIGSAVVDLFALKDIPFDQLGHREVRRSSF